MRELARQLDEALAGLRAELPSAYARMVAQVGSLEVALRIGDEDAFVRSRDGGGVLEVSATPRHPSVRVSCAARTILELADAAYTVEEALWSERLFLAGGVDELVRFDGALRAFLHGAVRSPSFADRLAIFRATYGRPDLTGETAS